MSEVYDHGLSEETTNAWKRLGVIGADLAMPDELKEFMNPANRSTASEDELFEDLLETGGKF